MLATLDGGQFSSSTANSSHAHACQAIGFAQIGLQHARDFAQDLIARGMAAGFVDQFELVQVDIQQGIGLDLMQALGQHLLQPSLEFAAVFQTCQHVVARVPGDLIHVLLLARYIAQHKDCTCCQPVALHGGAQHLDRYDAVVGTSHPVGLLVTHDGAFLGLADQLSEQALAGDGCVHGVELQHLLDGLVQIVLALQAQQADGRRIDVVDHALGIGGDDRIAECRERGFRTLLFAVQSLLNLLPQLNQPPGVPDPQAHQSDGQGTVEREQQPDDVARAFSQRVAEGSGQGSHALVDQVDLAFPGGNVFAADIAHFVAAADFLGQGVQLVQILVSELPVSHGLLHPAEVAEGAQQPDEGADVVGVVLSLFYAFARQVQAQRLVVEGDACIGIAPGYLQGPLVMGKVHRVAFVGVAGQRVDRILLGLGPEAFSVDEGAYGGEQVKAATGTEHQYQCQECKSPDALQQLLRLQCGARRCLHDASSSK